MNIHTRKAERASKAFHGSRYSAALRAAFTARTYEEDADGRRIRVWGNGNVDWVTKEDVRSWLLNLRVVEDLRDGLEYVREAYIEMMVRTDLLRKDPGGFYWITRKAAEQYDLPRVMGAAFPK